MSTQPFKNLLVASLIIFTAACTPRARLDASTEDTLRSSFDKAVALLPEPEREEAWQAWAEYESFYLSSDDTNQSPSEFVRTFRLHRAAELIKQNAGNLAEIAYQVGFNSQAYFTRSFQEQFGCSPREFRKQLPPEPEG